MVGAVLTKEEFRAELVTSQTAVARMRVGSPATKALQAGRASEEKLKLQNVQWYFHTVGFVNALRELYVRCPWPDVRKDLSESLFEEETGGVSKTMPHLDLYFQMIRGWGIEPKDIVAKANILPGMAGIVHWYHYACTRAHPLVGFAALNVAAEGYNVSWDGMPGACRLQADALRRHYGKSEDALLFYEVHDQADIDHSAVGLATVTARARTAEEQELVRAAIAMTHSVHRAHAMTVDSFKPEDHWGTRSSIFYS